MQRLVKLTGFVNSGPEFGEQRVINGVSDSWSPFWASAVSTRAAVSAASLPRNVAVEVDAIFEVKGCKRWRMQRVRNRCNARRTRARSNRDFCSACRRASYA